MKKAESINAFNKASVAVGLSHRYGRTYVARRHFRKGEVVLIIHGRRSDHQTRHTSMQVDWGKHLIPVSPYSHRFLNHSCDPNLVLKTGGGKIMLVAKHPIKKGQEVTYAYYTSEFKWPSWAAEPSLRCRCGSKKCRGKILSFSQLSLKEQQRLCAAKQVMPYLCTKRLP